MTSTALSSTSFSYIESDIPAGQTLSERRLELDAARLAQRRARRTFHLSRLRPPRLSRRAS